MATWEMGKLLVRGETEGEEEGVREEKRKRNNEFGSILTEERASLMELGKNDLEKVARAVSEELGEEIPRSKLRTKTDIMKWLTASYRWSKARGIVRIWFEKEMEKTSSPKRKQNQ